MKLFLVCMPLEKTSISIGQNTKHALDNLFDILGFEGTFDRKLFDLATMAFMGHAQVAEGQRSLISRPEPGRGLAPRRKINVKEDTAQRFRMLHSRLFPFVEWQSWDWLMNQACDMLEDQVALKQGQNLNISVVDSIDHDNDD